MELARGATVKDACRKLAITEHTYYRWRREYGGLRVDQARRLKQLEKENVRLKKIVAEKELDLSIRVGLHHEPMRARRIAQDARRAPDTWIGRPRSPYLCRRASTSPPRPTCTHACIEAIPATYGVQLPSDACDLTAPQVGELAGTLWRRRDGRSVLVAPSAATTHGRTAPPGSNRGCHGDAQRMSCDRVTRGELEHRPPRRADANTQGIRLRCGAAPGYTPEDMHRAAASGIVP